MKQWPQYSNQHKYTTVVSRRLTWLKLWQPKRATACQIGSSLRYTIKKMLCTVNLVSFNFYLYSSSMAFSPWRYWKLRPDFGLHSLVSVIIVANSCKASVLSWQFNSWISLCSDWLSPIGWENWLWDIYFSHCKLCQYWFCCRSWYKQVYLIYSNACFILLSRRKFLSTQQTYHLVNTDLWDLDFKYYVKWIGC